MEAGSQLQQRPQPTLDPKLAGGGNRGSSENFQQSALPGTVVADDAEGLAGCDLKTHVAEGLDQVVASASKQYLSQSGSWSLENPIGLAQVMDTDCGVHTRSRICGRERRSTAAPAPSVTRAKTAQ